MSYLQLAYYHLATVFPAFLIGTYLLCSHKGTPIHKLLGKIYMILMFVTALITLLMPAQVGVRFLGHFGFIHLLSLWVIYSVPVAWLAARRGDMKKHQLMMMSLYIGGILVAGGLTLLPGRLLHEWLFL